MDLRSRKDRDSCSIATGIVRRLDLEQRIFDPPGEPVDQLAVAPDLILFAPARHVGDRRARGVETERGADAEGDALDHDLLLPASQLRIVLLAIYSTKAWASSWIPTAT